MQKRFHNIFSGCLEELELDFDHFLPPTDTPLPPVVPSEAQVVLWELSELNFRFELSFLDKRASGITSREKVLDRQDIIACCFPDSKFHVEQSHATRGLASLDWKERFPILLHLRRLMRDWAGNKPAVLLQPDRKDMDFYDENDVNILEDAVARFYTQSFFNFFGRAAIIPTRLPPTKL